MSTDLSNVEELAITDYKYGFETDIEMDIVPKGLSEETIHIISKKKNEPEWMLEWRLKAYRHWLTIGKESQPHWANISYPAVDFQDIIYYAAPKRKIEL